MCYLCEQPKRKLTDVETHELFSRRVTAKELLIEAIDESRRAKTLPQYLYDLQMCLNASFPPIVKHDAD